MTIEYRSVRPEDYEGVRRLLAESGWEKRVEDPVRFRAMMERADRTVVVAESGRIIGFGRALCDDVSNGYISMVIVAADKRWQGIGAELVRRLTHDPEGIITWVLREGKNSSGFWKKMGFAESHVAMELLRRK